MSLLWPPKDPAETLDYDLDWTLRLAGDVILSSVWTSQPGIALAVVSSSFLGPITKIWLSGGVIGQTYTLVNTITTGLGDIMDESVQILMQSK